MERKGESEAPPWAPNGESQPRDAAFFGKRIDGLLRKLERRLGNLEAAKQAAEAARTGTQNSTMSAQQARCLFLALEQLGEVQDALQSTLMGETGSSQSGRRKLYQLGDNDCERVARLRALASSFASAVEGTDLATHPRLRQCGRVCDTVEAVMQDSGLSARLAEAKRRALEAPEKRGALIESSAEEEPRKRVAPPLHREDARSLLCELDQVDEGLGSQATGIVDRIFDYYDKDGNALVDGGEYDQVIADLAAHVLQEAQARGQKYGSKLFVPEEKLLKEWITAVVDPDQDGAITREEARVGFKKVVDDID